MGLYNELAIYLVEECSLNMFTARKIVDVLNEANLIDYDLLKEFFSGFEEN